MIFRPIKEAHLQVIHMRRGKSREALQGWRHLDAARRLGSALASTQVHPSCACSASFTTVTAALTPQRLLLLQTPCTLPATG